MRILAITHLYPNQHQPGLGPFNRDQFAALAVDHDVRVVAPILWTAEWKARRRGIRQPQGRQRWQDGMLIHHPVYYYTPFILRHRYGEQFLRSIRSSVLFHIDDFRPDVLFSCFAHPDGWAVGKIARERGIPHVVKVVGSDILTHAKHATRRRMIAEAVVEADGVVAVSRDLARQARILGADPNNIRVVDNGVDNELFCPGDQPLARQRLKISHDNKIILSVGNLVPVKGHEVLLTACQRLVESGYSGFRCHIVGEGHSRTALQKQIQKLKLSQRVILEGSCDHSKLADWYRAADVLALPSYSEGIPNVLLEASACGLPFVASDVGGVSEIAQHELHRLVPAGDAALMAAELRALLVVVQRTPITYVRSHQQAAREIGACLADAVGSRNSQSITSHSLCP